jgi:ribosomal protein S27AE
MINIFLSRPNFIEDQFQKGLDCFISHLSSHELSPRTVGSTDYPTVSPLDTVINLMKQCKGAIILGYPQIIMETGKIKNNKIEMPICMPTEWNHIEAALAYAMDIPLLLIHHRGITRGVFDRGTMNSFIYEKDLSDPSWPLSQDIIGAFKQWKSNLKNSKILNQNQNNKIDSNKPVCPNCSTPEKPFYMTKIPIDFLQFEDSNYECTKCKYKENVKLKQG